MTGQTLAQKLLARAAGRADVAPGEIVTCRVDLAMMHDSSGPRRVKPMLEKLGAKVWDPDKVVLVTDHYVPAHDDDSRRIVQIARDWARDEGVARFHDMEGICHVVVPQKGYLRPGMFAVGGDSHSSTGGAFGAYMFGIGATEMLGVLVTGEIWVRVPHTIRMRWHGRLGAGVSAKDMMLRMCTRFGMDGGQYQAVEYTGDTVSALSMQERMTLSNMTAELGGQVGLIAPDATTRDWLLAAGAPADAIDIHGWQSDADAACLAVHDFDAATLAPQVSRPHTPANADDVDVFGGVGIDIAYIGACTGAKLDDLRMAAQVLRGKRVARGTRLLVAPASAADQQRAAREGTLAALTDAGAELLPNACGACAGYGEHRFGEDTVVISATARNFKGRMGAASSQVYLGSPYTVAASAIAGRIADPREVLA
ncbi:3-isopropylmalate/(R)-2-methylmalate dehydratase large subunit [Ralstonia sp. 25mfcol4.1]|uniref:3-isopropylmalate dehydratase large subunit n=1 Tax=Burkholderiaceae TaxID=119060 RepID=UPI00088247C4|nr:3-isopropylmalate dehydratase large subunit [Ralstonia sp. 25mfcol4.1]SDP23878.1 3-isopropylmalate/(R)-2-methylmalate dehydratase large subunit [Ralstonia sp. 25mfcol4.1]